MNYHFSRITENTKLGFMATSMASAATCPPGCALRDGCYAKSGPICHHWGRVTRGQAGQPWPEFLHRLEELPDAFPFRYGQAGDLPGVGDAIDGVLLRQLAGACQRLKSFAYTHKPVRGPSLVARQNRRLIASVQSQITLNLSCDNLSQVDETVALGIGPVVTVLPLGAPARQRTPAGHPVLVCPQQTQPATATTSRLTCAACMLCQQRDRRLVVGFLAHGCHKKKVSAIANHPHPA